MIASVFREGYGVVYGNSLRKDFNHLRAICSEAKIVRHMDKSLYQSMLDRGITFEEAECCSDILLKIKRRLRGKISKYVYRMHFKGQIDNENINVRKRKYLLCSTKPNVMIPVAISSDSDFRLVDLLLQLRIIDEVVKEDGNIQYEKQNSSPHVS